MKITGASASLFETFRDHAVSLRVGRYIKTARDHDAWATCRLQSNASSLKRTWWPAMSNVFLGACSMSGERLRAEIRSSRSKQGCHHDQVGKQLLTFSDLKAYVLRGARIGVQPITGALRQYQRVPARVRVFWCLPTYAGKSFRYCIMTCQAAQAHRTGAAKSRASMRSNMPPWPGRIAPESFTPAPRLISDSTRSPN